MATALVAYTVVFGTFVTLAYRIPGYVRVFHDGERTPNVGTRLVGLVAHLQVRDIALGDVIRERAEEKGYGPEIEGQMEKLMVELYVEKKKRDQGFTRQQPQNPFILDKDHLGIVGINSPLSEFEGVGRAKLPQL